MANDYKVLYRKYRPTSFDEVIGQKYTISMLKNAVVNNKISHAYIFTGPRGTGKTSTAKIFAKTINCENPIDGIPCGKCESCLNFNNSADIIEIDAASNNGVDEVRELINNVKIAPSFSKYKVYIIDEVHMLSVSAFNALLLTLEEPPSHIVFILATTNIESVPITILSRCQRYDFKKISFEDLCSHINYVCDKENIEITEDAVREICFLSDGGCRDALSILNQLSTSNSSISLDTVIENYGSVSFVQINEIIDSFFNDDMEKIENIFNNLHSSSIDYKVFIKKMVDLLFKKALEVQRQNSSDFNKIKNVIFELNDLVNKINITVEPFMLIQLIFMKYMSNVDEISDNFPKKVEKKKSVSDNIVPNVKSSVDILNLSSKNDDNLVINTNNLSYFDGYSLEDVKNFLDKLQKARINNCFAEADKTLLKNYKEKWNIFNTNISSTDNLKRLILDCEVVLASSKINIVRQSQPSMVELFNRELINIENKYKEIVKEDIKFVAVSTNDWELYKQDYVSKLKEKYVYQILEEPVLEKNEEIKKEEVNKNDDNDADTSNLVDIFDKDKVVIK